MSNRKNRWPKVWYVGNGYSRERFKSGAVRYHHRIGRQTGLGNPTTRKRFARQETRLKKQIAESRARGLLAAPGGELIDRSYELCRESERRAFYNRVLSDLEITRKNLEKRGKKADAGSLMVFIDIGVSKSRRNNRGTVSLTGARSFRDLNRLEAFLLPSKRSYADWSIDGMCGYSKSAGIAIDRSTRANPLKKQIFRTYKIVQPKRRK